MTLVQICYAGMVLIAWVWALSQTGYALQCRRYWPLPWRVTSACWLASKAVFLSYVGYEAWHVLDDYAAIVLFFFTAHLFTFGHWLTLSHDEDTNLEPPTHQRRPS